MALEITTNFYGREIAELAQLDSAKLVSGSKNLNDADVLEVSLHNVEFPLKAFYMISAIGICSSSSEARRQIKGGAFRLDGKKIIDPNYEFINESEVVGKIIQVGKKNFRRIIL